MNVYMPYRFDYTTHECIDHECIYIYLNDSII